MARKRLTNLNLSQVNQYRSATQAARLASAMLGSGATDDQLTVAGQKILAALGPKNLDNVYRVAASLRAATGEQFPIDADSEGTESTDTPAFVTAKNVVPDRGILDVVTKERQQENKLTASKSRLAAEEDEDEDEDDEVAFEDTDDVEHPEEEEDEDHVDDEEDEDEDDEDFDFDVEDEDEDDFGDEDEDHDLEMEDMEDHEGDDDEDFTMEDAEELHDMGVDGALTDGESTKKASRKAGKIRRSKEKKPFVPKRTRVASHNSEVNEFDYIWGTPDVSDAFAD